MVPPKNERAITSFYEAQFSIIRGVDSLVNKVDKVVFFFSSAGQVSEDLSPLELRRNFPLVSAVVRTATLLGTRSVASTYEAKNVLITGGAGFIASHVAILFAKKYPHYKVRVFIFLFIFYLGKKWECAKGSSC